MNKLSKLIRIYAKVHVAFSVWLALGLIPDEPTSPWPDHTPPTAMQIAGGPITMAYRLFRKINDHLLTRAEMHH